MPMYQIISDSACDLSKKYLDEHNVRIVPIEVSFDGNSYYKDKFEINRDEFYHKMVDNPKVYPKTSLPSVEAFTEVFREYASQNIPMICYTISLSLSGSYNSAMNAKMIVEEDYPDAQILVIDSQQNTVSQALIIDQTVKMRDAGISFNELENKISALIKSARIFFTVGSLDYLTVGGRIGKVAVAATSKLGVKPIIILKDGEIGLGGIGRNRNKLKNTIIQITDKYLTANGKNNFIVSIGFGYDAEEGIAFMQTVEEGLGVKLNDETNVEIGAVTAVHTGPHAIGIGVIQKYETL